MLDEDEKFFKQNGVPLFSSHMIDLVRSPGSTYGNVILHTNLRSPVGLFGAVHIAACKIPMCVLITPLEEPVDENISTCVSYLKRMAPMKQWLEMEIGITV
jgi:fructose-bisphosphate aldolase class II